VKSLSQRPLRLRPQMLAKFSFFLALALALPAHAFDQSHAKWNELLKASVVSSENGSRVRYDKIESKALESYLADIQAVTAAEYAGWSESQKLTFLINAYNAFAVKWILDHKIPKSIQDTGGFFSSPWKVKFFKILGEDSSLDHIEHDLARTKFNNCRLVFAFNQTAVGSPMLRPEAWVGEKLTAQLEDSTRRFLRDSSRNAYEAKFNTLELSQLFNLYGKDFDRDSSCGGVKAFVLKYMTNAGKPIPASAALKFQPFDWSLNKAGEAP
jgi:hypothetical protein